MRVRRPDDRAELLLSLDVSPSADSSSPPHLHHPLSSHHPRHDDGFLVDYTFCLFDLVSSSQYPYIPFLFPLLQHITIALCLRITCTLGGGVRSDSRWLWDCLEVSSANKTSSRGTPFDSDNVWTSTRVRRLDDYLNFFSPRRQRLANADPASPLLALFFYNLFCIRAS
ncbi:hypothetical protein B0H12DRAFT_1097973 [Mycena haematopus]|nr:hypothetical protein B0H12DRAFT_1097973 [Mycena haematopus]